jgi:DegV family protein with EDD domain
MSYRIIVDSCCDLSAAHFAEPCFVRVPLTIRVDGTAFVDDATLDQSALLWAMKNSPNAPSTACPSPQQYADAFDCGAEDIYVVCLSAMVSGSHNSAEQGRLLLLEEKPGVRIHVFNSCSASSGEVLTALKIRELADSGLPFQEVVQQTERYIYEMNTYFVLESLDNLRKNGRLTKLQSIVTGTLHIKLIMGGTPEGEICKRGQALSIKQALSKMVDFIAADPNHPGRTLVISHCNCLERAFYLKELLQKRCQLDDILICDTHGISTVYANDGGIIVAY